jgi:polyhydroxyalkanoate synthesis regulator phasin
VNRALQRYLEAASGITNLTTAKAEQVVKGLVRSGEAAGDQAETLVRDLVDRQQRNRDAVVALVKAETTRAVRAMGLATGTEVERLQKQVADLKRELTRVERDTGTTPPSGASSAATSATTDGAATEEAPAKEATAKKATAKKATKKATAKKATAKKATAKKATKKATKKSTKKATKKATAKKSTKKATAKKAAKKGTAKKATKKKSTKKATSDGLSPSATSDGVTAEEESS